MRIVTIVGARPQFVKVAALSRAIKKYKSLKNIVIHTGQHYDQNMSEIFFNELQIPIPSFNLNVGSGSHGQQTGRMLEGIEKLLLEINPRCVIIYGDTNSTLSGALAAVKLHIPLAHIEAGLRSFNRKMPEEINRIVADRLSDFLFTPTDTATENLVNEGISPASIFQVGDVMHDAVLFYGQHAETNSKILQQLHLVSRLYVLATIHRAENTDDVVRLKNIFEFLNVLAKKYMVVVPLHPRTKQMLIADNLYCIFEKNIFFIDPVGYLDMINLEKHAALVVTDSGGVQKEAFFYGRPCVVLRDETEWIELEQLGWNKIISPKNDFQKISVMANEFIKQFSPKKCYPYGRGNSSELIVQELLKNF